MLVWDVQWSRSGETDGTDQQSARRTADGRRSNTGQQTTARRAGGPLAGRGALARRPSDGCMSRSTNFCQSVQCATGHRGPLELDGSDSTSHPGKTASSGAHARTVQLATGDSATANLRRC